MEQELRQGTGSLIIAGPAKERVKVPPTFDWDDIEDIAIGLTDAHPDTEPLTVRFTDMHKWIMALPNFAGKAEGSNESKLEAIQMAWDEEFRDRKN
jgi:FeS assembly protein IscX